MDADSVPIFPISGSDALTGKLARQRAANSAGARSPSELAVVRTAAVSRRAASADFSGFAQSHTSAPPVWYSVTRVSKKFFSLRRFTCSSSQGSAFAAPGQGSSTPS